MKKMTDRERKDYYLDRINKILTLKSLYAPWPINLSALKRLKEELKIIEWNNTEDWAEKFITEEIIPLLRERHLIEKGCKTDTEKVLYEQALDYASK